jgi:hypothetical protein
MTYKEAVHKALADREIQKEIAEVHKELQNLSYKEKERTEQLKDISNRYSEPTFTVLLGFRHNNYAMDYWTSGKIQELIDITTVKRIIQDPSPEEVDLVLYSLMPIDLKKILPKTEANRIRKIAIELNREKNNDKPELNEFSYQIFTTKNKDTQYSSVEAISYIDQIDNLSGDPTMKFKYMNFFMSHVKGNKPSLKLLKLISNSPTSTIKDHSILYAYVPPLYNDRPFEVPSGSHAPRVSIPISWFINTMELLDIPCSSIVWAEDKNFIMSGNLKPSPITETGEVSLHLDMIRILKAAKLQAPDPTYYDMAIEHIKTELGRLTEDCLTFYNERIKMLNNIDMTI